MFHKKNTSSRCFIKRILVSEGKITLVRNRGTSEVFSELIFFRVSKGKITTLLKSFERKMI